MRREERLEVFYEVRDILNNHAGLMTTPELCKHVSRWMLTEQMREVLHEAVDVGAMVKVPTPQGHSTGWMLNPVLRTNR